MTTRGKLIVFEGLDGSGKGTQLKLLQEYLQEMNDTQGSNQIRMFREYVDTVFSKNQQFELFTEYLQQQKLPFATYDFPQYYDNFWGGMVGRMLAGEFGEDINPYLRSIFYLLDQADASRKIRRDLAQGKLVICNRYITSSYIFQTGMFNHAEDKEKYIEWLEQAGYRKLGIVRPDVVLALYVKPEVASNLIAKKNAREYLKGGARDINEKNQLIQQNAGREMLRFCKSLKNWHLIDCMEGDQIKPQSKIALEIRSLLKKYI